MDAVREVDIQEQQHEAPSALTLERLSDFMSETPEAAAWLGGLLNADPAGRRFFFHETALPDDYLPDYLEYLAEPENGCLSYVVRDAGHAAAGFCYLEVFQTGVGDDAERMAKVAIFLHPSRQGRGLGKVALEALKDVARECHIDTLIIETAAENIYMRKLATHCGAGEPVVKDLGLREQRIPIASRRPANPVVLR